MGKVIFITATAKKLRNRFLHFLFDLIYNVKTNGVVSSDKLQTNSPFKMNASRYGPILISRLKWLIDEMDIDCKDFHFLDVGCGKGRACFYAASKYDFISVQGFDFNDDLIAQAWDNFHKVRIKNWKKINFFCADAGHFKIPSGDNWIIFMYNPFDKVVMERFISNNLPRIKAILYANNDELETIKRLGGKVYKTKGNLSIIKWN